MRLRDLYRKVHFITSMAGLADCPPVGQMASAFEALLFELMARPSLISASPLATSKAAVDFLGQLLESAPELTFSVRLRARVLVVDDDRLSSRLFVTSLQEAHLQARSTDDPDVALDWAGKEDFQLFLLDIEMPGMNGFELCKQLRAMPKYESTPVVYVTSHSDFQSRSEGMLSGGNDLIAKPVLAPELAVKAVMHLLRNQLSL
jgi:CheY-like chemotaxis protein